MQISGRHCACWWPSTVRCWGICRYGDDHFRLHVVTWTSHGWVNTIQLNVQVQPNETTSIFWPMEVLCAQSLGYYRWFRHTRGNRSHAITPTCSALHKQIFDHNIMYNGTSSQTFAPLSGYFMGSTDSFQRQILETRSHRFGTQKCIWFLVDKKINRDEILQSPLILVEMIVDSISPKLGSNKSLNHTKFSSV